MRTSFYSLSALCALVLFVSYAPAPGLDSDFGASVLKQVSSDWAALEKTDLEESPYRDKQVFCPDLEILMEAEEATSKDRTKAAKALERQLEKGDAKGKVWRTHELRARLLMGVDPKKQIAALEAALAAYPSEPYESPAKHSNFQHLAADCMLAKLSVSKEEPTRAWLLDLLKEDERYTYFSPEVIEEGYLVRGLKGPLQSLYGQAANILEERDKGQAERLRTRSIPDVRLLDGDPQKLFIVLEAKENSETPKPLVLILAGGNGQAFDFLGWVKTLTTPLLDKYTFALLSAPVWNAEQTGEVIWVTERNKRRFKAKFTVESFIRGVAAALQKEDPKRTPGYIFTWSSGGPATYETILSRDKSFQGAYVLASVFHPNKLELKYAKGKRFYLEQGFSDKRTAHHFAKSAAEDLKENGAETKLVSFEGGHGFDMPEREECLRKALEWLTQP